MNSAGSIVPRPVFLPSGFFWNTEARMVGEALRTVVAAAVRALDGTRYLVPALTWQVAADQIADCVTTDHRADHVRVLLLPAHALEAIWACRAALVRTTGHDAERLADLLDGYLQPAHHTGLPGLIETLDRVLAILALDLPPTRTPGHPHRAERQDRRDRRDRRGRPGHVRPAPRGMMKGRSRRLIRRRHPALVVLGGQSRCWMM
ncbi:hypothetical protein ACFQ9J_16750 [Streptomyces sp. NPDC056529]|uniref:hypothetical protein n=1 Tax=Streptomyces sp. NPDC056529 TaxID=3345855 RepID=UPI00368363C3